MSGVDPGLGQTGIGRILGFPEYSAAEQALQHSLVHQPEYLQTYVELCKLYFYSKRLEEAEQVARAALIESSRQGGFEVDWRQVEPHGDGWKDSHSPQRVYLYMLKALSFIRMRQEDIDGGNEILRHLNRLDPDDLVGGSVVGDLAKAVSGGRDDSKS